MRRPLSGVLFVAIGLGLMVNPLYLPATVGEPEIVYAHSVQEVDATTPEYDPDDVVAYEEFSPEAQTAFDRALESDGDVTFADPDERIDEFDYPREPRPGAGLLIVERNETGYELWTRSAEREGTVVFLQRAVVQPALFLFGFFAVAVGAVLVGATLDWWDGPSGE